VLGFAEFFGSLRPFPPQGKEHLPARWQVLFKVPRRPCSRAKAKSAPSSNRVPAR
jgi:hypothetical protein